MCNFSFLLTPCPHWVTSPTMSVFHFLGASSNLSLPFPAQKPLLQTCVPWSPRGRGNVSAQPCGTEEIPSKPLHPQRSQHPCAGPRLADPHPDRSMQYLAIFPSVATLKSSPRGSTSLCTPYYMAKRSIFPSRCEQKPWESLDLPSSGYTLSPAPTASWWHSPAQPTQLVTGI